LRLGGGEYKNVQLLHALFDITGDADEACTLWRDLRHATNPESLVTTDISFISQSPMEIDESACPLDTMFYDKYPGAVLFDKNSFKRHAGTVVEPCGRYGQVVCPPMKKDKQTVFYDNGEVSFDYKISPALQKSAEDAAKKSLKSIRNMRSAFSNGMSNALLITAENSESGHPLTVFGPQTGYFSPSMFLELSLHGGDIHTRGVTFTGLPYVIIGRGIDYAWSPTSGGSDIVDIRVLKLCDPESTQVDIGQAGYMGGYIMDGRCKPFDIHNEEWTARWNLGVPITKDTPFGQNFKVTRHMIRSLEYGPVIGFANVDGISVALTRQRSTYMGELDTAIPFMLANKNDITDAESFIDTFYKCTGTFNWFYVDNKDIAYIHSGLYPERAKGVHPDLPSWGTPAFDWKGWLDVNRVPHAINPTQGYLASWNNRPAHGWWAADTNAAYGSVHRLQILSSRVKKLLDEGHTFTRGSLFELLSEASTVDLRGQEVLPSALKILKSGTLKPELQTAVNLLGTWVEEGAMRRDKDGDGAYDRRDAVVLMDSWYNKMIDAILPQITQIENVSGENLSLIMRDNTPGPEGSAYMEGYYGYLRTVMDMAIGRSKHPYNSLKCADSDNFEDCREALTFSLVSAIEELGGIDSRNSWGADGKIESNDSIDHMSMGLAGVPKIPWVNRPTFQQVIELFDHR